ncbi:hypothetical protein [Sphingobacterium hotanense]|uniref:hypothetical protein n=1 Tax=Sphingobacterium hotanense TaxID=649196 RepID=UPI0011F0C76C|nr:hypothetical protein [Sphingobacterium hotanense]
MKRIKVSDGTDILEVNLLDILNFLSLKENICWCLVWVEGFGNLRNHSIIEFEQEVNKSNTPKLIDLAGLIELSKEKLQFINLLLIGDENVQNIQTCYENQINIEPIVQYRIELLDSSYWLIETSDESFIKNILENFVNVEFEKY